MGTTDYMEAESSSTNLGIVFQLIDCREWEGVISFFNKVPEAASLGRVVTTANDVMNLPLHEVCRQRNPPLTVVNLLLELNPSGASERGQNGYLPLHYACKNDESSTSISKVIRRLLEANPSATRCRNEDDALPLHLACQSGTVDEDAMLSLLATNPEGFFMKDVHGKTPLEYTRNPQIRRKLEQIAPTLMETAKAVSSRNGEEFDIRERGIEQAHAEYVRQLNLRQQEERNDTILNQIELQDELATEKERNINLAEMIIEKERTEQELKNQLSTLQRTLQQERNDWNLKNQLVDQELRNILQETGNGPNPSSPLSSSTNHHNESISRQLSNLVLAYQVQQNDLAVTSKDLEDNQVMVRNLNQLIASKDVEINDLLRKTQELQNRYDTEVESNVTLQASHNKIQQELQVVRDELTRVQSSYTQQQEQLTESNRLVRVQDSRLASIKSLAQSLNFNIESWAMDDNEEGQDGEEEWCRTDSAIGEDGKGTTSRAKSTTSVDIINGKTLLEGMETVLINHDNNKPTSRKQNASTPNTSEESTLSETAFSTRRGDYEEDNNSLRSLTTPLRARILNP